MFLLISAVLGIALGITSHLYGNWGERLLGAIEGFSVITGFTWLFYSLNLWWWLAMILSVLVFAVYLIIIEALTKHPVKKIN